MKAPMMNRMLANRSSIGAAARAVGLNPKAIRYYEQIGLIPKATRRANAARTGGDRIYSDADIGRLRFIREARKVDLSLADIRELLKISDSRCPSTHPVYTELLRRHIRGFDQRINHLLRMRSAVHRLLSRSNTGDGDCCSWETCGCMHAEPGENASKAKAA